MNQVVDLVHVKEVDADPVLAEEDGLRRRLVRADPFGLALVGDLEEPSHVTTATGDVTDLEGDLLAFLVFGEVDEREATACDEIEHSVGTDAFACFEFDHRELPRDPVSVLERGAGRG